MAVSVVELEDSEEPLAGEMVSPFDPPKFWKVVQDTYIYCVCTTEEHASAIAGVLNKKKVQEHLMKIRAELDKGLNCELDRRNQIRARCAHKDILRYALVEWDGLVLSSGFTYGKS